MELELLGSLSGATRESESFKSSSRVFRGNCSEVVWKLLGSCSGVAQESEFRELLESLLGVSRGSCTGATRESESFQGCSAVQLELLAN